MLCADKQQRVLETFRAEPYGVVVHLRDILQLYFFMLLGIWLHFMCFTTSVWKVRSDEMAKSSRDAALRLSRSRVGELSS